MGAPDRSMWAGDNRWHTAQGPPILTRYQGEQPKVNVVVSTEMHRKISQLADAHGWTFSRAARFVLASGLNATRAHRRALPQS